jgi:chromosomal replication initiation ATPase DnaA
MARKKWPALIGPQEFIDWVKATYKDMKGSDEMPQIRELYPDTDRILSSVCAYYDVAYKDLFTSKRGTFNEPRCVAVYLLRRLRRDSLKEIGKVFNLEKNSSVSSIIERMKTRIKNSRKIKMGIKKMEDEVRKS